jgi:hypothetical protein
MGKYETQGDLAAAAAALRMSYAYPLVVQGLARLAGALLAGAESTEVLHRLGDNVTKQAHNNAAWSARFWRQEQHYLCVCACMHGGR